MSCKKESDYQKFLKEWKAKHLGLASSPEMRKNWLKHASADWNKKKNELEAEKKKKEKEHESSCKLKATSTARKITGTPLRLSTSGSADALGLSSVELPEKRSRTLAQCRVDLQAVDALKARRKTNLCDSYCAALPVSAPVSVPTGSGMENVGLTPVEQNLFLTNFRMHNRPQHRLRFF